MSLRFLARPKWIAWTLVVVLAVVVMVNLALWQYDRLGERRADNEVIAERMDDPPRDVAELLDAPGTHELADELQPAAEAHRYRPVTATGTYDTDSEFLVANQTLGGSPGWWLVTPLIMDNGEAVAVNRGWIPFASTEPGDSLEQFAPPQGPVEVVGTLHGSQREVGEVTGNGVIPHLDLLYLQSQLSQPVVPLWLQSQDDDPEAGELPATLPAPEIDEGPHLSYTGQWAIFATLTVVVYLVLIVRTAQRGGTADGPRTEDREPAT